MKQKSRESPSRQPRRARRAALRQEKIDTSNKEVTEKVETSLSTDSEALDVPQNKDQVEIEPADGSHGVAEYVTEDSEKVAAEAAIEETAVEKKEVEDTSKENSSETITATTAQVLIEVTDDVYMMLEKHQKKWFGQLQVSTIPIKST